MSKRLIAFFSIFCLFMSILMMRIATLSSSTELKQTAAGQSSYTLTANAPRGQIYDRDFNKLVGGSTWSLFAMAANETNTEDILDAVSLSDRDNLYRLIQKGFPFLTNLFSSGTKIKGVKELFVTKRYDTKQLASHIIGYMNGDGKGVTGIEEAYNDFLSKTGETTAVSYNLNGLGKVIGQAEGTVKTTGDGKSGVVLTIDREIQSICETVGASYIEEGAIVVMDPSTGKLLACASFPTYDPSNVAAALKGKNSPMLNRCFSSFAVGSTFKVALAAAALESGIPASTPYTCTGQIDVSGKPFNCHLLSGHGPETMKEAMVDSCNTYFINIGQMLGAEKIVSMAKNLSYGLQSQLADGMISSAGNLPALADLKNPADVANLSFGQGTLLATPIQLCAMIASIANKGKTPIAQLVEGTTKDGKTLDTSVQTSAPIYAMSEQTASIIGGFLEAAVEQKADMKAKPDYVTAAGKTATAQTGSFDSNGVELLNTWFAGYFPAEQPKYAVSVLVQNGKTGNLSAGPVFAKIADQVTLMDQVYGGNE